MVGRILATFPTGQLINPLNPNLPFWLHHTALHMLARRFCVNRKRAMGGGGWGHLQGDMHMVAARLGCQKVIAVTWWAASCLGCMESFRKLYSHLIGG